MNMEREIEKLHELLDAHEEDLFRLLFVQVSIELGDDRIKLLGVVFHAMDVMTWNFASDCMEVDILGNKGINVKGDPIGDYIDYSEEWWYERGGRYHYPVPF
jgi:hypothetical protein